MGRRDVRVASTVRVLAVLVLAGQCGAEKAWTMALQLCAAEVCHENQVEENDTSAALCAAIPVASLFGGAGRSTLFGRTLWCAAMLSTGPVLDLYSGLGDSSALLVHALAQREHREGGSRSLVSFERDLERLSFVAHRLQQQGTAVQLIKPIRSEQEIQAIFQRQSREVSALLIAGSTRDLVRGEDGERELLEVISTQMAKSPPGLLFLDPDVETSAEDFARDWRSLEAMKPQLVAIYNTNLPGGAGWILNRLLALGTYEEIAAGSNDGGAGERDPLRQLRAWSLLLRRDAPGVGAPPRWSPGLPTADPPTAASDQRVSPTVRMVGDEAKEWIAEHLKQGWSWQNTTFRAVGGGEVLRIHRTVGEIVPVEVQRPTEELLKPPTADTNPRRCLADFDPLVAARQLRVPCFLSCEGPGFDERWGAFRRKVLQNAQQGYALDEDLLLEAVARNRGIVENDEILIHGRSRFVSRLRHEYTHDSHLEGFCLFGITAAAFIKGRHMLGMEPVEVQTHGKRFFPPRLGLGEMDVAYTMVTDSDSTGGIEFSFLENSGWAVSLEDIITNLAMQKSHLGAPFELYERTWPPLDLQPAGLMAVEDSGRPDERGELRELRICGLGDHLTATFDAVLMAEQALGDLETHRVALTVHRRFLGRYCPKHATQGHQCRQRCELLGSCEENEDNDPVARWLDGVIHPVTLEELPFDLPERQQRLAEVLLDLRIQEADLLVCSHPTLLCMILATLSPRPPLFVHASSTLLYGLRCNDCTEGSGNLRHFGQSQVAQSYLMAVRMLLLGREQLSFLAEGRFLAEQIHYQVGVRVSWAPPLALYTPGAALSSTRSGTRRAVVLRSRFFVSLMGELLRSLLREVVALNVEQYPLEVIFLGKDKQFEEQWLSLKQLADFDLAILWPNDLHQRTFHEVYRMAMPLLMPDAEGLFRAQKMCNWGYASYGARLAQLPESTHPFEPWWNSWSSSPQLVSYWERFSDWQQMPHVQRFASLPGLVVLSLQLDLEQITAEMSDFHRRLCEQTLGLVSKQLSPFLPFAKRDPSGSRWLNVFPIPTSMSPAPVPPTRSSMKESLSVLQREVAYSRKVQRQHRHRFEDTSSKAPLYKGTLFKLNTDGNADEPAHWLKRDMWVACDGSLCYFSIKENKRLVLLDGVKLAGAKDDHEQDICMCFSAESEAEYQLLDPEGLTKRCGCDTRKWRSLLSQATNLDGAMQTIRLGGVVADELKQFRLAVKNRRMKVGEDTKDGRNVRGPAGDQFAPVFKAKLWKVKAEGDRKKAEDWFEREMWIAKNGSLVYWSKKEDRELVYYTADDIANAKFIFLEKDDATHPWAFQVQLAPNSGVEFAPGEFAAESEALRDRTLDGRPLPGGHLKGWRKGPGCDCGRRVQEEAIWPELATDLEL
ncbi:unnamed protein product [Durusdinium trenchii]|uniref:Uncharacterized protein n=1 Tax=Durusdinium trenchii TaxID=1381693 RepID=A0ABP0L2J6_9DINO